MCVGEGVEGEALAAAAVKVGVWVDQERSTGATQAVHVVPAIAVVALDPLHRVLLGQPTAQASRTCLTASHLSPLLFLVVIIFVVVV